MIIKRFNKRTSEWREGEKIASMVVDRWRPCFPFSNATRLAAARGHATCGGVGCISDRRLSVILSSRDVSYSTCTWQSFDNPR